MPISGKLMGRKQTGERRSRLTDRQRDFVAAYCDPARGRGNASEAARRAGYRWPGKVGPRLTQMPAIAAAIRAERRRRDPITAAILDMIAGDMGQGRL